MALLLAALLLCFIAGIHSGLRCDDTCVSVGVGGSRPGPWTDYRESWQWTVQFWLAASTVPLAVLCLGLAERRRAGLRFLAAALAVGVALAWLVWVTFEPQPRNVPVALVRLWGRWAG
ncbi:MAG TPA: hypothetical protein VGL69_16190 [Solirubrobacteraceae bacterium]